MSFENPTDYLEMAASLIAIDNGAISGRFHDLTVEKMMRAVKANHSVEECADAEEYLSGLTAEELDDVCFKAMTATAPKEVEAILTTMINDD